MNGDHGAGKVVLGREFLFQDQGFQQTAARVRRQAHGLPQLRRRQHAADPVGAEQQHIAGVQEKGAAVVIGLPQLRHPQKSTQPPGVLVRFCPGGVAGLPAQFFEIELVEPRVFPVDLEHTAMAHQENGTVCGITLPEGLKESDKLPEPIYTPSTKAEIGDHDENISFEQSIDHLEKYFPGRGRELAEKLRDNTIALYKKCAEYALSKGIIIADTKFEFGLDEDGNMVIGDEMLTPDSSRFWPAEGYEPGHGQPSFDKQFARDWLTSHPGNDWTLPQEIVDKTIEKYLQAYKMLTGKDLD